MIENEAHSQVGFVVGSLNLSNRGLFLCLHSLIQTPSLRQLCKPQTQLTVLVTVDSSSNFLSVSSLCKHRKTFSVALIFVRYFSHKKKFGKWRIMLFILLLDWNRFFGYAFIFPTSQPNVHETSHNQSSHNCVYILSSEHTHWPMRECILF